MNKYGSIVFFMIVLVISQTLCMLLALSKVASTVKRFRVEEPIFLNAVDHSVSNYLERIVSRYETGFSPGDTPFKPRFVSADVGTWVFPSGRSGCRIDGVTLKIGDYCEYGLIVDIGSGVVYCLDGVQTVIVRCSPPITPIRRPNHEAPDGDVGGVAL